MPAVVEQTTSTITTLDNGMRIVVTPLAHSQAVALALWVGVGSRGEARETLGLSHYLEHMLFKGTESRPTALEISSAIEGAGGTLNAFTTKEATSYWNRVPFDRFDLALDILTDSLRRSLLSDEEIERERTVIQQEIRRGLDEPAQRADQLLDEAVYGNQPLGWDIAGDLESVAAVRRSHLVEHIATWYQPANMVLAIAGNVDADDAIHMATKAWRDAPNARLPARDSAHDGMAPDRTRVETRDIEQCNLTFGLRTFKRDDPDRYALTLLNSVLGSGMSSRLFLEVRERRGLAYAVGSHLARHADTGHLVVGAGVTQENVLRATDVILTELRRMAEEPVESEELERARAHSIGSYRLSLETATSHTFRTGDDLLHEGRIRSIEEVVEGLGAVSADDILRVAQRVVRPGNLAAAVVGPYDDSAAFEARIAS